MGFRSWLQNLRRFTDIEAVSKEEQFEKHETEPAVKRSKPEASKKTTEKASVEVAAPTEKPKRTLSPEHKAKISAAQKARVAAKKAPVIDVVKPVEKTVKKTAKA